MRSVGGGMPGSAVVFLGGFWAIVSEFVIWSSVSLPFVLEEFPSSLSLSSIGFASWGGSIDVRSWFCSFGGGPLVGSFSLVPWIGCIGAIFELEQVGLGDWVSTVWGRFGDSSSGLGGEVSSWTLLMGLGLPVPLGLVGGVGKGFGGDTFSVLGLRISLVSQVGGLFPCCFWARSC